MSRYIFLLIAALLTAAYVTYKQQPQPRVSPVELRAEDAARPESSTRGTEPEPQIERAPATAPPKEAEPTPAPQLYLAVSISIPTDDGIIGLRLGTPAQRQPDGQYLVGGHILTLSPSQLTTQPPVYRSAMQTPTPEPAVHQTDIQTLPAPQQRVDPRPAAIAAIRAQIAQEEAAKTKVPPRFTKQGHINAQNEKIRLLQLELGRLGVTGAALERR